MSKILINIKNDSVQIDTLSCTIKEFSKIEPTFAVPSNITEIECNTDESQRQCIKDGDGNPLGISTELKDQLLGYIKNIESYQAALAVLSTPPAPTLDEAKNTKIFQIKSTRDALIVSDITTSKGFVFSADESSQFRIYVAMKEWDTLLSAQGLDPETAKYPWGSTGLVGKEDLQEAYFLIQQRLAKVCGVECPTLEAQVNACTSVDDVLDKKGNVTTQGVNGIEVKFL